MSVAALHAPVDMLTSEGELSALGRGKSMGDVARQFEAVFVSMMLKEMRQSLSGDGLIPTDNGDIVGGLFDQFLGQHISEKGGLGLAASLEKSMVR